MASPFSPEDDASLLDLRAKGLSWAKIAENFPGQTDRSVRTRWNRLTETPEQRAHRLAIAAKAKRALRARIAAQKSYFSHPVQSSSLFVVPDRVLAEREERAAAPRTLTQMYFGDPAPQQSALYQKTGSISC